MIHQIDPDHIASADKPPRQARSSWLGVDRPTVIANTTIPPPRQSRLRGTPARMRHARGGGWSRSRVAHLTRVEKDDAKLLHRVRSAQRRHTMRAAAQQLWAVRAAKERTAAQPTAASIGSPAPGRRRSAASCARCSRVRLCTRRRRRGFRWPATARPRAPIRAEHERYQFVVAEAAPPRARVFRAGDRPAARQSSCDVPAAGHAITLRHTGCPCARRAAVILIDRRALPRTSDQRTQPADGALPLRSPPTRRRMRQKSCRRRGARRYDDAASRDYRLA